MLHVFKRCTCCCFEKMHAINLQLAKTVGQQEPTFFRNRMVRVIYKKQERCSQIWSCQYQLLVQCISVTNATITPKHIEVLFLSGHNAETTYAKLAGLLFQFHFEFTSVLQVEVQFRVMTNSLNNSFTNQGKYFFYCLFSEVQSLNSIRFN